MEDQTELQLQSILRIRGVHGPGWVGLGDFFDPNPKFRVGWIGNPTQPKIFLNPTQPNPLFSGWVRVGLSIFKFYLSTIYNYSDTIFDKIF